MSYPDPERGPGGGPSPSPSPSRGAPSNRQLGWLAVAALVVVVIAIVVIVVSTSGSGQSSQTAGAGAGPGAGANAGSGAAEAASPGATGTAATPSPSTSTSTSAASGGALTPAGGPVPSGFEPESFTAVSDDVWWVMGSAECSSPPCESIVRTADGGQSFVGIPAPRSDVATNLRFADLQDGYAYGASQLWSTHDGGSTWNRVTVSGSVESLSTADGYVYVGTSQGLLRSPVSSDSFQQIESGDIASVWTQGSVLYADTQSSSGGPSLLISTDHGGSFQQFSAPEDVVQCSFSSTRAAVIWAPCATGTAGGVWRSGDDGRQWDAENPTSGQAQPNSAAFAAASTETAVYGSSELYRTTDGGQTWAQVTGFPGADATVTYLGFSDATHGVAIVDSGTGGGASHSALYVTDNGGVSYSPVAITAG